MIAAMTRAPPQRPSAVAATSAVPQFVCPMHAQIVRDVPGFCSICGMALEPRVAAAEAANTAARP
jgi:P-type Cu+ transporter